MICFSIFIFKEVLDKLSSHCLQAFPEVSIDEVVLHLLSVTSLLCQASPFHFFHSVKHALRGEYKRVRYF